MSRQSQLVDQAVDIFDVARRYGLDWADRAGNKATQIHCPMHVDLTPSARVYPSNSLYCWTCQRSIGPTGLVATLEGCSWARAVEILAGWYHVDLEPNPDEDEANRLIGLARGAQRPESDEERAELRRAVAMGARAVGLTWEATARLLVAFEQLDLTDIDPETWASTLEALALQ